MRELRMFFFALAVAALNLATGEAQTRGALTPPECLTLVGRAVNNELQATRDQSHPMRYQLRKTGPNQTTTKEIVETKDGAVARLLAINDRPPSAEEARKDQERLDELASNPDLQRKRRRSQDTDRSMVIKVLRQLPTAFLYEQEGSAQGAIVKLRMRPNPAFEPPDMESIAMQAMSGRVWIDTNQERLVRLESVLDRDTNFYWGILGKLNKGGTLEIEQAETAPRQWRTVRMRLKMNLRIVWKVKALDTVEEMSRYAPAAAGIDYRQAIGLLRGGGGASGRAGR